MTDTEYADCTVYWGSGSPGQMCTLPGGHDGDHRDRSGFTWETMGVTMPWCVPGWENRR